MDASGYRAYKDSSLFVRHVEVSQGGASAGKMVIPRFETPSLLAVLPLVEGKSVLDQGCGWGLYTAHLSRLRPARLVAADLSPSMLKAAQEQTFDGPTRIEFRLADSKAPSGTSEFHLILANFLFPFAESLRDLHKMALAAHRSLKTGGQLVGFVPNCSDGVCLDELSRFGFSCHPAPDVAIGDSVPLRFYDRRGQVSLESEFRWFPPAVLRDALLSVGFASVRFLTPGVDQAGLAHFGPSFWQPILHPAATLIISATK